MYKSAEGASRLTPSVYPMAQQDDAEKLQDNPHAHLPLPDYAKKWHPAVYRPKRIPEAYEPRIDPAHIFALPFNPDTEEEGEYFIVANRCTMCARVRNICSRGDPACRRCVERQLSCVPYGPGYVELPLPRMKKQPLKQEVQALKKSLPDAPYYRDHSASIAKTMAMPPESASALRKGTRSVEQGSVSPAQKKRRGEQGHEKASVSRRDSRKRASASPQREQSPVKFTTERDAPAKEQVPNAHPPSSLPATSSAVPQTPTNHTPPSAPPPALTPTPAPAPGPTPVSAPAPAPASAGEPRQPLNAHPMSVVYVTANRPSSLSMVTNGAHTFVGAIPYQASAAQAVTVPVPNATSSPRLGTVNSSPRPQPTPAPNPSQNEVAHVQPPSAATATAAAASEHANSPSDSATPGIASTAARPAETASPPATDVTSPRLSIRVPPRSILQNNVTQPSTSTPQKPPSTSTLKAASETTRSQTVASTAQGPVFLPQAVLPMHTIYDILNAAARGIRPPNGELSRPAAAGHPALPVTPALSVAPPGPPSSAEAPARPAPAAASPRPAPSTPAPSGSVPPVAQEGQSISAALARRSSATPADQSCSFRLSTSAAWNADGGASESETSGDEPLKQARKRKHAQDSGSAASANTSANASASARPAAKRRRPAATAESSAPHASKPAPTPWWTAQASIVSGHSWYSTNGVTSYAAASQSASTSNGKPREEPFLSPLRPPLPSIQQRAERFAPLQEPPPLPTPQEDSECDSEEEVAQYLKPRPRRGRGNGSRTSPSESPAPVFVPRQKFLEDSAVVLVEDVLLHLPRSRLVSLSEYFAKQLSRDSDADEQTSAMDQCPVVRVTGVCAEDLEVLLGVCDDPSVFIQRQPPFKMLIAVFCAARTLRFRQIDALATSRLESLWPSDLHKLSPVRTPHAAETVVVARMYNLPSVLKRAFYELLRSEGFSQQGVEDAALPEGTLLDGSRLIGRAKLSHADLVRLITTREKLQMAWTLLVGTAPSPAAFPCMLQQTTSANTAYSTHSARERCLEACRNSAQIWAEWVLDSGLYENWMYDPICGLERLSVLDWENSGYCSACVMTRRQLWARKREEIWDNLDTWLGL